MNLVYFKTLQGAFKKSIQKIIIYRYIYKDIYSTVKFEFKNRFLNILESVPIADDRDLDELEDETDHELPKTTPLIPSMPEIAAIDENIRYLF